MTETLSIEDSKHLLRLCKAGRLFDLQRWIDDGNSLVVPANVRATPLEVALDTGFHSLIELLLRKETNQDLKNRALRKAVSLKRLDFIELLVSNGAEITSVEFRSVLEVWEPTIIRYFLDHGADVISGSPFTFAFGEKIRTAINPWREYKQNHPEFAPELQEQIDRALRHFCYEGNLKWVSLLMWAGANPRTSGPTLKDAEDEWDLTTALQAAAYCKDVEILKRLKPDPKTDDLVQLMITAAGSARTEVVRYLIELGAAVNDKPNGGSTALDECLSHFRIESFMYDFHFSSYRTKSKASKYAVSQTRATIELLLEHSALWRPDDKERIGRVRRSLLECESEVTLELVERLMKHSASSKEDITELLRTPSMKKQIESLSRKFMPMGFDVRTTQQKLEDKRQKERTQQWALQDLASRYNREEIYKAIWAEPIQHVAKRYNLSDVGLAKICKRLNIPRPGRGYWAIKAAGKRISEPPPLPSF